MLKTNFEIAEISLQRLSAVGVKTLCICPGARNSPWIALLDRSASFEVLSFFDERSAGFFALSRARSTQRPVAVITTSGTAVGELLPAVMEAQYSGAQLVVLSADRPKRFRGTGAPQSCLQNGIFGAYVQHPCDIDRESELLEHNFKVNETGPSHWNVCFEEPLPSSELNRSQGAGSLETSVLSEQELAETLRVAKYPLIVIGELTSAESEALVPLLSAWKIPIVTEPLSQLRERSVLEPLRLRAHHNLWEESKKSGYPIDLVLRFGGVPTLRFWRDLEVHPEASKIPVIAVGDLFRGLPRAKHVQVGLRSWIDSQRIQLGSSPFVDWKTSQREKFGKLEDILRSHPLSEPSWFRRISEQIPDASQVYLGNSLPIREWDLAAGISERHFQVLGNRGLNGIDGQMSSFFGGMRKGLSHWCVLGDLTALYDSTAPWILPQLDSKIDWHLIIINNSGGQIFQRMFDSKLYLNSHAYHFQSWAGQWGLSYKRVEDPIDFDVSQQTAESSPRVFEIVPSKEQTVGFWHAWEPV